MIGISFVYPDVADQYRHPPWLEGELRVSRLVNSGEPVHLTNGKTLDGVFWRRWELPFEEAKRLMDEIVKQLVQSHKVDGFTLWWNWTKKQWQMNVRREGGAWSVTFISQAEAEAIFSTLQAHHPDGPWNVSPEYVQNDAKAKADIEGMARNTPVARAERQVEDVFDSLTPSQRQPDILDALRRAESVVQRGNDLWATLIASED